MSRRIEKNVILKREILLRYKSIREFANKSKIPYSTIITALDRGVEGMAYSTVMKMCELLELNPVDFSALGARQNAADVIFENRVMEKYIKLNSDGQKKVLEVMDDLALIRKYKANSK